MPPAHVLALNFSCLPQMEAWHKSGPPATASSSILSVGTYHWSRLAACPFSSSSSCPRWREETQGVSSRQEEGVGPPWKKAEEGTHPHLPPGVCPNSHSSPKCPWALTPAGGIRASWEQGRDECGVEHGDRTTLPRYLCPSQHRKPDPGQLIPQQGRDRMRETQKGIRIKHSLW